MRPKTNTTNYKDLLLIMIPTTILVIAWIGFTIYGSRVKSTIDSLQSKRIEPISPTFDFDTITALKGRDVITPLYTFQAPPTDEENTPVVASSSAPIIQSPQQIEITPTVPPPSKNASEAATTQPSANGGNI